jgi:hypothetical protein
MSNPGALGAVTYEAESAFAEDTDTTTTLRLPTIGPVDVSGLQHAKIDPDRTRQYRMDGSGWILGTMSGSFKTKMYLSGHGSVTTGAISITAVETLLGIIFGNAVTTATGTTLTGGTANIPTTTDSGTLDPGDLCFIGALGDGDGNGQCYAVATHTAANLTLLTDLQGAPVNGAVRYGGTTIYPSSDPTATTISSLRMLLQTANLQYLCHGCYPTAVAISGLNPGEVPTIEVTWAVAWWEYKASTFPSAVATDTSNPAAVAAGSLFVNTVGTATSSIRTYRNFSIEYTLGVETLKGPGGVNPYQDIVGCRRTPDSIKVSWTEDADAATTSPVLAGYGTSTNRKHVLWTGSTADGSRIAMYMPNVCISNVAVQKMDSNLNRLSIEGMAYTGGTTTSPLTLSPWRLHSA